LIYSVWNLLEHALVQTTVRYTQENIENLRRRYLLAHACENEYRAYLAELQERLTKAAYKRARRHQ